MRKRGQPQLLRVCAGFSYTYSASVYQGEAAVQWVEFSSVLRKLDAGAVKGSWVLNLQIWLTVFLLLFKTQSLGAGYHAPSFLL